MKKSLVLICGILLANVAQASELSDSDYTLCDKMSVIDNLESIPDTLDVKSIKESGFKAKRILVSKSRQELYLISDDKKVKIFPAVFGKNYREGHKQQEGDYRTPEGIYTIDYKNDLGKSSFRRALHVSYPNKQDTKCAAKKGISPGGAIMIHGSKSDQRETAISEAATMAGVNWTQGCVAVKNANIDLIYDLVPTGTLVEICGIPGSSTYTPPESAKNDTCK
ncbi:L,D-transpeptidase family protein [Bdellovibrio reynosensis]|uniref:L,D-transpeptidase family protein n=1 Tax=Bdellovibrio reynosensis TaxID=2835041 RepID=A0ABY4CBZ3_9BACT|nr:L,D-transpeptidase family protein [Bdellovibrio reynosensis]UOF01964.1 L,D-transpeptidase family protein [Bdellovibrio reynosensis]